MWQAEKSEIGVLYLSEHNEDVILKLIKNNQLKFEEMFVAEPHVFICKDHPRAEKEMISMEDLRPYPYLVYEQGNNNSFYFSEEFISMLDFPKSIQVRDRATLFNPGDRIKRIHSKQWCDRSEIKWKQYYSEAIRC